MTTDTNYARFSADDFIKDEFFQRWVYFPNAANTAFWRDFIAENPEKTPEVEEARRFLQLLDFKESDVFESRVSALKGRIDMSIDGAPPTAGKEQPDLRVSAGRRREFPWIKAAAVIALFVLATLFSARYYFSAFTPAATATLFEQTTDKGQRTMVVLKDGTRVWMNVDSRLRYPADFTDKPIREVYLDGEAFFEVSKDTAKPFIVRAGNISIRVLGTSFNVKSYEKDGEIQTALIEGKVTIESDHEETGTVTLSPNQVATYDKSTKRIILNHPKDIQTLAGWKEGKLIFDNKPLAEIVTALERWFDVDIEVEDEKSLKCHFSAKIENLPLVEVLELLKTSDGIDYAIDGREVVIRGRICEP